MNEIGLKRLEQIGEAVNTIEWSEVSAGLFAGNDPEYEADVAVQAEKAWAMLARHHLRWLLVTVLVERSRADYFKAKVEAA